MRTMPFPVSFQFTLVKYTIWNGLTELVVPPPTQTRTSHVSIFRQAAVTVQINILCVEWFLTPNGTQWKRSELSTLDAG